MNPPLREGINGTRVTATVKQEHAARNEGDNAIYKVLDDIAWSVTIVEKESPLLGSREDECYCYQCRYTQQIVRKCNFIVDVRSNELYTNEELFAESKSIFPVKPNSFIPSNSSRMTRTHLYKSYGVRDAFLWLSNIVRPGLNVFHRKNWSGRSSRSHTKKNISC